MVITFRYEVDGFEENIENLYNFFPIESKISNLRPGIVASPHQTFPPQSKVMCLNIDLG